MEGKKMLKMMVLGIVVVLCSGRGAPAGEVVAWGWNLEGQCDVPEPNEDFIAVAGGALHSLGLKKDGSIAAWGRNNRGQCDVPLPNTGFIAVAGGDSHSLGLKEDGSIAAWGWNNNGQCNVPSPNEEFIAVAGGDSHSLGLKEDGSIVAWGWNNSGQLNVPSPNEEFIAVAAGIYHSLGLKADGSIVAWGMNVYGQCTVPLPNEGFVAVAGGGWHSLGLKADGSIAAWGYDGQGRCNVPEPNEGFIAVAGGDAHSLGLKEDGSIVAWGDDSEGQCDVTEPNEGFVAIARGGGWHSLGLKAATMGTAFTYQGRLIDANSAAEGPYDFEFRLSDGGGIQQGNAVKADNVDVIDGYFTVELDFNEPNAFKGDARWVEVGVRPGELEDPNEYTTLSPRQELTPTPYALHAKTAESIAGGGHVETDPQVGAISNNYVPKWDGSALVTGTMYDNGNVGIGTTSPMAKLEVVGTVNAIAFVGDGSGLTGIAGDSDWTESGGNVYRETGNVGIGTTSPTNKLDVQGGNITVNGFRVLGFVGSAEATGNNTGNNTWQDVPGAALNYNLNTSMVVTFRAFGTVNINGSTAMLRFVIDGVTPAVNGDRFAYCQYFAEMPWHMERDVSQNAGNHSVKVQFRGNNASSRLFSDENARTHLKVEAR